MVEEFINEQQPIIRNTLNELINNYYHIPIDKIWKIDVKIDGTQIIFNINEFEFKPFWKDVRTYPAKGILTYSTNLFTMNYPFKHLFSKLSCINIQRKYFKKKDLTKQEYTVASLITLFVYKKSHGLNTKFNDYSMSDVENLYDVTREDIYLKFPKIPKQTIDNLLDKMEATILNRKRKLDGTLIGYSLA